MAERATVGAVTIRLVDMADADEGAALVALRRAWVEERRGGPVDDPGFEATLRAWLEAEAPHRLMWVAERTTPANWYGDRGLRPPDRRPLRRAGPGGTGGLPAPDGPEAIGMLDMLDFRRMPGPGRPPGGWGYIGQAFVLAPHRDRGIGRMLLDEALAESRRRGHDRVVLSPTARSVPFYRRAGFGPADTLLVHPLD